jgi:DNA-binding NarL/FixJ family response regulator
MKTLDLTLAVSQPLLAAALEALLLKMPGVRLYAVIENAEELLGLADEPAIILLGRRILPAGAVTLLPEIRLKHPGSKVIVISDSNDVVNFHAAVHAGCDGYLTLESGPEEFGEALRVVAAGGPFVPVAFEPHLASLKSLKRKDERSPLESLSRREREVLQFLSRGNSYKEIAERLELGVKSIETYRARLFKKLNFDTKADLMRFAIDQGLMRESD